MKLRRSLGADVPALQLHPLVTCIGQQYRPHPQKIISSFLKTQAASCYAETMKSVTKDEKIQPNKNKQGFGVFFYTFLRKSLRNYRLINVGGKYLSLAIV